VGACASTAAFLFARGASVAAAAHAWPPFVLVAALLVIGVVADEDHLFESAGARLAKLPGRPPVMFLALMALVALVTVVLNLDTSVAFLTPVLLFSARRRGIDEAPLLYGAVFLSNAASLLLPGSNLTNLLVAGDGGATGLAFAARTAAPWAASVVVTVVVVGVWFRRALLAKARPPSLTEAPPLRLGLGAVGALGAAGALVALASPALPVLALAIAVAVPRVLQRRVDLAHLRRGLDAPVLLGLFGVSVALGALARSTSGSATALASMSAWQIAGVGALASVVVNNLPAAVLLSSWGAPHRVALLVGLDVGPNLAVSGSLSAVLWMRVARTAGAAPSARTHSKIGVVLVPPTLAAALVALALTR
jgi:arsenical pump membrane protein